jgi:nucleoside-diphosphate-sugar epimerase
VEWVQGDLCDEMAMKSAAVGVDTVFHLAAKVHETHERSQNELEYERVNVGGTVNVLKAAEASGAQRLVLVSSVKAMGEGSDDEQDEETVPVPETAYGRSKLLAEEAVRRAAMSSRLQAVSLRLPMVYGPGNKGNLFRMMTAIDRGYFPPWPAVANRRSMVHVANVVEAACLSAENPVGRYECYIVTDGGPYSTRELYELMVSALGKRVPTWKVHPVALRFLARLGDAGEAILRRRLPFDTSALDKLIGSACYSSRKIARDLAFRPRVAFHTALPELTAWYRSATA